ncbi:MAG: histidine kinase [Dysgonomonas sp.]|nr:histidine kinase [Dysgonomonas sp.]
MEMLINRSRISSLLLDDRYRIARHVTLQIVILMITIGVFFDAPDKLNLSLNRFGGWIGYSFFVNMLVYFNAFVLFPRFLVKNKIFLYIVSLVLFTFFALSIQMVIQEYFYDIAVTNQEQSSLVAIVLSVTSSLLAIFFFLGGISALMLFKHWMTSNRRIVNLRLATSQTELNFLKSQINPHFLFNMLNNANILIEEDPRMASYILSKLDYLLQYQLNDSEQDKVYLEADINFLSNFLELEKIRRDNFEYKISITGNTEKIQVAPLLFIPFVENAVKHNLSGEENSYVHISFEIDKHKLVFDCINSTSENITEGISGGLGLANIKRRLDLLYGQDYLLKQTKNDTVYTVNLQLKL